jgi:hypothetical protein
MHMALELLRQVRSFSSGLSLSCGTWAFINERARPERAGQRVRVQKLFRVDPRPIKMGLLER